MAVMLRYDLRLYWRDQQRSSAPPTCKQFEAEDDLAAVDRAVSLYADELAACRDAMISSVGGRMIWRKHADALGPT